MRRFSEILNSEPLSLGTWFGIKVQINQLTLVLFVILFLLLGFKALVISVLLFGIILAHEFGHCFAAQKFGIHIFDITFYPYGGMARMDCGHIYRIPYQEFMIAIAGPFVNVLFIPVLVGLSYLTAFWLEGSSLHSVFSELVSYNLIILFFNLIPAFPLDGGRILRSIITYFTKNPILSTKYVIFVGKIFSILFLVSAFVSGQFILAIIALVIWLSHKTELQIIENDNMNQSANDLQVSARLLMEQSRILDRLRRQSDS